VELKHRTKTVASGRKNGSPLGDVPGTEGESILLLSLLAFARRSFVTPCSIRT